MQQLDCLCEAGGCVTSDSVASLPSHGSTPDSGNSDGDSSGWLGRGDAAGQQLDARQEVLQAHNLQLNKQLLRLKALLNTVSYLRV